MAQSKQDDLKIGTPVTLYDDAKGNKTGQRIAATVVAKRGDKYTVVDGCGFRYTVRESEFMVYSK